MRRIKCFSDSFCYCWQLFSLSFILRSQKIFKMNSKETDKFHNMSLSRLSSRSKANSDWFVNCRLQGIWYWWDELNDRVSPYKGRSLRCKGGVIILRGICSVYWNGFWQICGSVKYFETIHKMQDHRLRDPVNPVLMHFISPPTNPNLLFAKKLWPSPAL